MPLITAFVRCEGADQPFERVDPPPPDFQFLTGPVTADLEFDEKILAEVSSEEPGQDAPMKNP